MIPLSLTASERDGGLEEPQTIIFDHPLKDVEQGLNLLGLSRAMSVTAFGVRQVDVGWMPEGDVAEDLAITPDGTRVLVSNKDSDNVTIYSMTDLAYVTTIPVGDFPENIKITPDGQLALVANVFSNSVSVIDVPGESLLTEIPVGEQPVEIEVARDTNLAYVANLVPQTLSVIDLNLLQVDHVISGVPIVLYGASFAPENGNGSFLFSEFRVTPDGGTIIFPDRGGDVVFFIDATTGNFIDTVSVTDRPNAIELTPDGNIAVVASEVSGNGEIVVIDVPSAITLQTIPVDDNISSKHIAVTPDSSTVLVGVFNALAIVNIDSSRVDATLPVGAVFDVQITQDGVYGFVANYNARVIDIASRSIAATMTGEQTNTSALSPIERKAVGLNNLFGEQVVLYNINGSSGSLLNAVPAGLSPEGDAPRTIAISPDGSIAVTGNILSDNASIIDIDNDIVLAILPTGDRTGGVDISSDGNYAVVASIEESRVSVIDLTIPGVVASVGTRIRPFLVDILPGDTLALALTLGNPGGFDYITVIRLADSSSSWVTDIPVGQLGIIIGGNSFPSGMGADPQGEFAIVANSFDDDVDIIDLSTTERVKILVVGDFPLSIDFSPSGDTAYVTNYFGSTVSVISVDGINSQVIGTVPVQNYPIAVKVRPDGAEVFVSNFGSDNISVIRTSDLTVIATIPHGSPSPNLALKGSGDTLLANSAGSNDFYIIDAVNHLVLSTLDVTSPSSRMDYNSIANRAVVTHPTPDLISIIDLTVTGVEEPESGEYRTKNFEFRLLQNHPNPFYHSTTISYIIPSVNPESSIPNHVSLNVYDITGRLVETLVDEKQEPGIYQVQWDGRAGILPVRSGIYFYRLNVRAYSNTPLHTSTKKLILLR
jgi:YVTN family beta-propeller protein